MGQSSQAKQFNQQQQQNAQAQLQLQQQQFNLLNTPTPEQQRFRTGAANWQTWISGHNYGKPPADEMLNFDLYNPAHQQQQRERLSNLTGVGASSLAGSGDQSIALQQSKERNSNLAAQDSANAYENAVKQTDAYYKGNALAYSQQDINTHMGLLGNASQGYQYSTDQQRQTLPPSFWTMFAPIIGGAVSAGGAALGNPSLFHK